MRKKYNCSIYLPPLTHCTALMPSAIIPNNYYLICLKKPQQQEFSGTEEIFMLWTKNKLCLRKVTKLIMQFV